MVSRIEGDFGVLEIEVEMIDVTSGLPQPSKTWRYTDHQGHEHYWQDGYPTLRWVVDETYYDEDLGEDVSEGHSECAVCGETIVPGSYVDTFRKVIPGRRSAKLNGELISEEQYNEIVASMRR